MKISAQAAIPIAAPDTLTGPFPRPTFNLALSDVSAVRDSVPLRERPDDILPLACHFRDLYCERLGYACPQFSAQAEQLMRHYPWPGNMPELESVIHFALLVSNEKNIEPQHLRIAGGWASPRHIRNQASLIRENRTAADVDAARMRYRSKSSAAITDGRALNRR